MDILMSIAMHKILSRCVLQFTAVSMTIRNPALLLIVVLCLGGLACSDDDPPENEADRGEADAAGDSEAPAESTDSALETETGLDVVADLADEEPPPMVNPFPVIPHTPVDPEQDPDGHEDMNEALDEGEARSGMITSWDTGFGGPQTDCRPDDFVLYNNLVRFCISGETPISQLTYTGGHIIDGDMIGSGTDRFYLMSPQNHLNLPSVTSIEVLSDGGDGTAVVSVRGTEEPLALFASLVGPLLQQRGVTFETEYRLHPDVTYLEIVTWITAPENSTTGLSAGDVLFVGDTTQSFTPNRGLGMPPTDEVYPWFVSTGEGRSYGIYAEGGFAHFAIDLSQIGRNFPLAGLRQVTGVVPPGEEAAWRRYFVIGEGGTREMRRAIAQIEGVDEEPQGALFATTLEEDPQGGAWIVISDSDGNALDILVTDEDGEAELPLPPGAYTVVLERWSGGSIEPLAFTIAADDDTAVDIQLPPPATLRVAISAVETDDGEPAASPGKVALTGDGDLLFFTHDGSVQSRVPPGTYDIVVSRGEEYSFVEFQDVLLESGELTELEAALRRVWNTDGLIGGEFHQHSTRSFDAQISQIDRLLTNIGEGVDFVVPTEHEAVSNFTPFIEQLGAENLIYAMEASEVSPTLGHFAPMPMAFDRSLPNTGGYPVALLQEDGSVYQKSFPEMVEELRADYGVEVIQINHPRTGGAAYFSYSGYRPLEGPEGANPRRFSLDFDAIEVFNAAGANLFCEVVTDWLSFTARGHRITGLGNSDTHTLEVLAAFPRNYLPSDAVTARDIDDDTLLDAIRDGNVSVSGTALITFPDGPALGSTTDVDSDVLSLHIQVQTAVFSSVDHLLIIVDGRFAREIDIEADLEDVVVFDDTIEIDMPDHDTYLVAVVWGDTPIEVVAPGEYPLGWTNPIFLDIDGDEVWTPPGVADEDDLVFLPIDWCR
jgi:hypothetical protein